MAVDVALEQKPKGTKQTEQGDRDQQMDHAKAVPTWPRCSFDEDGGDRGDEHERHPGVAKRAVQAGALRTALASPQGNGACRDGQNSGCHVHGNDRVRLHDGLHQGG